MHDLIAAPGVGIDLAFERMHHYGAIQMNERPGPARSPAGDRRLSLSR